MKMPDDWIIEYEEYRSTELKGNTGIYDNFNDIQLETIKSYFKWKTKKRFKELCKNTNLEAKPKKAEVLANIMGNAVDWVYDGCVDTGYLGASHCELGHALRYEHYAYSPSTDRSIKFGVNCAADFFGIEPEKLRKINSIQDETLNEIKLISFIRNTGKQQKYTNIFYGDLISVIDVLRKELNETFGADWNQQMGAFLRAQLPFTSSMIDRLDYVKKKYYFQRAEELKRQKIVEAILGGYSNGASFLEIAKDSKLHLIRNSMGYIANYAADTSNYRIKCNNFVIEQAIRFKLTYDKLTKAGVKDFESFADSSKKSIVYVHAQNGDRVATLKEKEAMGYKSFTKDVYYLTEEKHRMLQIFGWAVSGSKKMYRESECKGLLDGELTRIEESAGLLRDALKWLNSKEFSEDIKKLASKANENIYLEQAEDEIQADKTFEQIVDYILVSCPRGTQTWSFNAAIDICEKHRRFNRVLTDKQMEVVRKAYDLLTKLPSEREKSEAVRKAEFVIDHADEPIVGLRYKFELEICKTVASTLRASEKQENRINIVYEALTSGEADRGRAEAKQIFIDEPDDKVRHNKFNGFDKHVEDKEQQSRFVDTRSRSRKFGKVGDVLIDVPSVVDISQALGSGAFKIKEAYENE